jgi:hypothetical protein
MNLKRVNFNKDKRTVEKRKYDLPRLQALHHEILRLKLSGMKNVDIAERLNCDAQVVSYTVNSTIGKNKLAMMNSMRDEDAVEFSKAVEEMLPSCLKIYKDILTGEKVDIRLKKQTADTIVKDLAGRAAPKRVDARHVHAFMDKEAIEDMKERGLKAARAAGVIVEVENG